jgi:eukaryotic-like serine/threonine-protein kinase
VCCTATSSPACGPSARPCTTPWRGGPRGAEHGPLPCPGGRSSLRAGAWSPGTADPVAALVGQEIRAGLPAYRRIRIEALPKPPGGVWEYTFRDPAVGPVHGLERAVGRDGRTYLIEWHTPTSAWAANLQNLAVVLDSLGPPRGA